MPCKYKRYNLYTFKQERAERNKNYGSDLNKAEKRVTNSGVIAISD